MNGFYKGVDIDDKNPSEKEIKMWAYGCNAVRKDSWNRYENGNAAVIETI